MSREVPEGWKSIRVGEIAEIRTGGTPSRTKEKYWGGEILWMASGEIHQRYVIETAEKITEIALRESNARILPVGSIMIALNGQGKTRGKAAILRREMACNQSLAAIIPNEPNVPEYFLFLFESMYSQLRNLTGDDARNGLNLGILKALEIDLPPLPEQRRIAEILSSVDEAIASSRAVIEQTRKVKQGVLERLLTKGIGHTRFKQTEIGEIPEGWELKRLEEIADIDRGKFSVRPRNDPRYFGGDIPFVQTGDVVSADGRLRKHSQTLNALGKGVSREFPSGTILITIAANIGDTAITTYPVCCPDSVVGIVPNNGINVDWLREFLVLQKSTLDRQATQNAQKNINLQHLRPMQIPVPPMEEQRDIGRCVQAINDSISQHDLEFTNMTLLKSALMSDLLTGRKRVTDALPLAAE